jgi:hypothetical protein
MRLLVSVIVLLSAVVLASCGSSKDSGSGSNAGRAGGNAAGEGGVSAGRGGEGGDSTLDGRFELELELAAEASSCWSGQPSDERLWVLVGAVDFDAASAVGYLALNGVGRADGSIARYTLGSTDFEGSSNGWHTEWEAAVLYEEGGPPEDELAIKLELSFTDDGEVEGRAEGVWLQAEADLRCERPFTASVTGGPDRHAPGAVADQRDPFVLLPFDSITGYFTEPVAEQGIELRVETGGENVPARLALSKDRGGRPRGFEIVASDVWPGGAALSVELHSLRDAAGNEADVSLGPFLLPAEPDSASNAGFEDALAGWLTDPTYDSGGPVQPASIMYFQDELGKTYSVTPPEGSRMMYIEAVGVRLIAHFAPAKPAKAVAMMLGVSDPTILNLRDFPAGFRVSVFSQGKLSVIGDGSDLPQVLPDARGNFTGFLDLTFPLPEGAGKDFWLVIEPWGYAPPVHLPSLLVDDVRLL